LLRLILILLLLLNSLSPWQVLLREAVSMLEPKEQRQMQQLMKVETCML